VGPGVGLEGFEAGRGVKDFMTPRGQGDRPVVESCDPRFFLEMGMMIVAVEALTEAGTWHVSREVLKMLQGGGGDGVRAGRSAGVLF